MTRQEKSRRRTAAPAGGRSRRDFVVWSAAAGFAAATGSVSAGPGEIIERDVEIRMQDGRCDAAFIHPSGGAHPGVLIWTDIFGLRPAFRAFGRRLAAAGYAVLVPNPFYRTARAPVFGDISGFNFQSGVDRARLPPLVGPLQAAGAAEADASAYVAFLDGQPQVDRARKIGTQGYCMGGPLVLRTAASIPQRVGAGASFHGGGLVTDKSDSPHLLAPKIRARLYVAVAANDDARQPEAKAMLRAVFAAAGVNAEVEVYAGTQHGWCVPDMPPQNGTPIYARADAETAWNRLLELYRTALG